MARVTVVKKAQQRYETVPVLNDDGSAKTIPVLRRDGSQKTAKGGRPVFRTVTVADKTKPLPPHKCEKCGKTIEVGMSYRWIKPKSGPYGGRKRYRCLSCPSWRPSETTSSSALASIYGAQEAAEDALNAWDGESLDDIEGLLSELADGIREGGEAWRESAQNIEDGFGHPTSQSEELTDRADQIDSSADDVESEFSNLEEFDEDAIRSEKEDVVLSEMLGELDAPLMDYEEALKLDGFDAEDFERRMESAVAEAREEWADGIREQVSDIIGNVEIP